MRARSLLVSALALLVFTLAGVLGARAQVPQQVPTLPGSTTTTAPRDSTTTTTAPREQEPDPEPGPGSTTTTTRPGPQLTPPTTAPPGEEPGPSPGDPLQPAPGDPGAPPPPATEGGDGEAPTGAGPFPAELRALMQSIKRTGPSNSRALVAALQPLADLGVPPEEIIRVGYGRFPVAGPTSYVHDWWFPRFGPGWRLHQGTDMFAPYGTPVRAPASGTIRITNGGLGGLSTYVIQPDGGYFYLTHLSAHPVGLVEGQQVKTGDVVGFVGTSGNAAGTSPHLHFEFHPAPTKVVTVGKGKRATQQVVTVPVAPGTKLPAVDPKSYLDFFLSEALANVPKLISAYEAGRPRAVLATGLTRRLSGQSSSTVFDAPHRPPRSQLLWASSANPAGGALALAGAEAAEAARSVRWRPFPERRPAPGAPPASGTAVATVPGRARFA